MRQSRLSGSVEGVMGNHDSYSDWVLPVDCTAVATLPRIRSVPLDMGRIHSEHSDTDPSDRSLATDVFLRQEPDEEEEEDEGDGKEKEDDDDEEGDDNEDDDGYSE
jgi:hypothetical protein